MNDEPASPVCYAAHTDDVYMGYAGKDEISAVLNELLEIERAAIRIVQNSKASAENPEMAHLIAEMCNDEAKWCTLLASQIRRIGAVPSRRRGAYYGKTIAIPDPYERLSVLTRVQVRKLSELIPRVREDSLHATLSLMKARRIENIMITEQCIALRISQAS